MATIESRGSVFYRLRLDFHEFLFPWVVVTFTCECPFCCRQLERGGMSAHYRYGCP